MWNWSDGRTGKEAVIKMALCKCKACPRQGKFQIGKYYSWYIAPGQLAPRENATMPIKYILPDNLCVKGVHDDDNKFIHFSPGQYPLFFKDVQHADISISVYIDRKNELLFAPVFTDEKGFGAKLSYFAKLPLPYTEDQIGREFLKVWEEYKDHPIVSTKEKEEAVPYYKIVTKGKGFRAFASGRWMIEAEFFTSENEMLLTYWYKCSNGFEIHTSDTHIQRIVPISASFEEIGHAILSIYEEAGII